MASGASLSFLLTLLKLVDNSPLLLHTWRSQPSLPAASPRQTHIWFSVSLHPGRVLSWTCANEASEQGPDVSIATRPGARLGSWPPLCWPRLPSLCPVPSISAGCRPHTGETQQITDLQAQLWAQHLHTWALPVLQMLKEHRK